MMPIRTIRALGAFPMRAPLFATMLIAVALVAGCASTPPDHFFTLRGRDATSVYKPSAAEAAPFYVEVPDATIPDDVARAQMVVDLGNGRVGVVEHQRWIAPLQTEISGAMSEYLTRSLHTIDVYRSSYSTKLPVYRVGLTVRRFISVPGTNTSIDLVWTVRRTDAMNQTDMPVMTCRSVVTEQIGGGYDAIAQGHRRELEQIAADIGGVITQLSEMPSAAPPASKPATSAGKNKAAPAPAPVVQMPACP